MKPSTLNIFAKDVLMQNLLCVIVEMDLNDPEKEIDHDELSMISGLSVETVKRTLLKMKKLSIIGDDLAVKFLEHKAKGTIK